MNNNIYNNNNLRNPLITAGSSPSLPYQNLSTPSLGVNNIQSKGLTNNNNLITSKTGLNSPQTHIVPIHDSNQNKDSDLPKLGRKKSSGIRKSVSFKNEISITKVENWKKYNKDMSEENEYFKLKKEIREFKQKQALKEKQKNDCCCEIF